MSQAERASRTSGYLPYFSLLLALTVAEVIIAVFSRMDLSLYVRVLVLHIPAPLTMEDGIHLTSAGSARVARALWDARPEDHRR